MASLVTKLLQGIGVKSSDHALHPAGEPRRRHVASHAQPRVEPGSMLDLVTTLDPNGSADYLDALRREIDRCMQECTIAVPAADQTTMVNQIHTLKNTLVPFGSQELLRACEQLRSDVLQGVDRDIIARRFQAVASAAAALARSFAQTLTDARQD
ncbi:hypothetical protein CKY51_00075 [Xanthomonas maliensis]|nr:hypothetical protein CKY51_00075 [Xanthomonas maliensis]